MSFHFQDSSKPSLPLALSSNHQIQTTFHLTSINMSVGLCLLRVSILYPKCHYHSESSALSYQCTDIEKVTLISNDLALISQTSLSDCG